jgi:hypothetical protein
MQADYLVELGRDDETLEFPWAGPEGGPRYYDLKRCPENLTQIEEAVRFPELREFLARVNAPGGALETAKCDAWASNEMNPEEEIFGAPWKFGSYVDLISSDESSRYSFDDHERLLKKLTGLLQRVPEIPAAAELLLRRCFFHGGNDVREGFYVTFYLLGYGQDGTKARQQWAIALKLASNAITQLYFRNASL